MPRPPWSVSDSLTRVSEVMMPLHANHYGSVHGGTILKLVDEAAFVAATKHSHQNVVLASMGHIDFRRPVRVGDLLTLTAALRRVGRTSMEVEVSIVAERIKEGTRISVGEAVLTMVAIDERGRPVPVPALRSASGAAAKGRKHGAL